MNSKIVYDKETKCRLKSGSSIGVLGLATVIFSPAFAQNAEAPAEPAAQVVQEVVVTGSRVVRNGFTAPTPTTGISIEEIQKAALANIADFVNQMPQLSGSSTPRVSNQSTSTGTNGQNNLNLRSLGANRTLVLLDGKRVVGSSVSGAVDVNNLPNAMVQRVEVVTGGASAAYGSDAISGVVNFILNKDFTGLKANASAGITSRNDDKTANFDISYGRGLDEGRGHLLLSAEYGYVQGIDYLDPSKRDWFQSAGMLTFGSTVRPQRIVRNNVYQRTVAQGGVITSTALANTQFGAGGVPSPFVVGSPVDTNFMVGGNQWFEGNLLPLDAGVKRGLGWGRVLYDLTDNMTASLEASYGYSRVKSSAAYQRYPGSGTTALVMSASNPFLDAATAARAAALGVTQFNYGYSTYDLGRPLTDVERGTARLVAALEGTLGADWKWNAYYQYGQTKQDVRLNNTTNNANFALAIDAVRNPATGAIVCRSTLANPGNGCVPLNIFGYNVASDAARAYVKGTATQHLVLTQNVAAATISGEPFKIWAGPVSVASGVEFRKEEISGNADDISLVNGFQTGNFKPTIGSYDVKEAFAETVVPLAKDLPFAKQLDFNGAVRRTDYSLAGGVTTWKAGLSYTPISDLRFRAVRSRDIRAPNLGELFLAGQTQAADVFDTANAARSSIRTVRVTSGNTNLKPEEADTKSFGMVLSPSMLPQFSASIDSYSIAINGAIATLANQEIVDRCVAGESSVCSLLVRNSAGTITQLLAIPINIAKLETRGVDLEASWRQKLGGYGTLTLRGLMSRINKLTSSNGPTTTESAGENAQVTPLSTPKTRWFASATYDLQPASLTLTVRGISSGKYNNAWTSGVDIEDNHIPGARYIDLSGTYRFGAREGNMEAYFKIENLMDKDPVVVAGTTLSSLQTNPAIYDVIGRNFRVGMRFKF